MILTRSTRLSQPTGPVEVDWQNVYANGIEFAYIPGFSRDLSRKRGAIQAVGAGTTFVGGTMETTGTSPNSGLVLGTGALLGPMQKSTVLAIANTRAPIITGGGLGTDGAIGTGGNALYSERAYTGSDIYKLGLVASGGTTLNAEFVYRNDGGNLLQHRVNIAGSNDGRMLAIAAVKSGTAHSVYCNTVSSVGTFGSASSAFTNANIQRRIGSDIADETCAWNGQILLVVGWSRALSAFEIAEVKANPWQLFRPVQRRTYFDMGAGGGGTTHTVTAAPAKLGGTTTRPGLTQTHVTTARAGAQGTTVTRPPATQAHVVTARAATRSGAVNRPAITQTHVVTARAVAHGSTVNAPAVEIGSITVVTARPVVQPGTVNAPSIVQTHIVTARPVAQGGTVTRPGQAQGHQAGSTRPGFEMSSRKVYVKRGKRIHIFDTVEDADEWLEAEDKARQVVNAAKPKPQAKAKVFKALDEAIPHEVVRLDVVRAMVDYLGIPVEMPTLEARQDWAEVARVALMARQMQDEEDIELLLAA